MKIYKNKPLPCRKISISKSLPLTQSSYQRAPCRVCVIGVQRYPPGYCVPPVESKSLKSGNKYMMSMKSKLKPFVNRFQLPIIKSLAIPSLRNKVGNRMLSSTELMMRLNEYYISYPVFYLINSLCTHKMLVC